MANADQLVLLARQHQLSGRLAQAEQTLRRVLQGAPGRYDANHLMALVLLGAGTPDKAEYFIRRAVSSRPADHELHNSLGLVLAARGGASNTEAARAFEESARLNPAYAPAWQGLANLRTEAMDFDAAQGCYARAAGLAPHDPSIACNAAMLLLKTGRADEAAAMLRTVLNEHPGNLEGLDRLAHVLNYIWGADPDEVFGVHAAYGRTLESLVAPMPPPTNPREPDRRLRIGLLSPDLRSHSVASFLEPFLEHHDRAGFEVVCYSTSRAAGDATTERLRGHAALWREVGALDDAGVAERVRADRADVLVELSGHTAGGRLGVMARKPVPVQGTFIGYPHTTGLSRVDFRLVDALTDPPGPADAHATERLARLAGCFLCYAPPRPEEDPGVAAPPSAGGGPITFGSFNHLPKIGPELVGLWSRVLVAVPGSRLVLKSLNLVAGGTRERLLGRFAASGVDPARVELLAGLPSRREHLGAYARIDVALDTFPYHGTTTTCESLWMGVPVATLAGGVHASRVGVSLLTAAGIPELIADTPDGYAAAAAGLARDAARRAMLRGSLRERVRGSSLCDGPGYARRVEGALREAWRVWCSGAAR